MNVGTFELFDEAVNSSFSSFNTLLLCFSDNLDLDSETKAVEIGYKRNPSPLAKHLLVLAGSLTLPAFVLPKLVASLILELF